MTDFFQKHFEILTTPKLLIVQSLLVSTECSLPEYAASNMRLYINSQTSLHFTPTYTLSVNYKLPIQITLTYCVNSHAQSLSLLSLTCLLTRLSRKW